MEVTRDEALSLLRRFCEKGTVLRCRLILGSCVGVFMGLIVDVSDEAVGFSFATDPNPEPQFIINLDRRPVRFSFGEPVGEEAKEGIGEMIIIAFKPTAEGAPTDNISFGEVLQPKTPARRD